MITAKEISDALGGRKFGKSYRSPCPVCGGSQKSSKFSMTDASDRVLVYCFAGCQFIDIVRELRSRGLWPDSTPEQQSQCRERQAKQGAEHAKVWLLIAESAVERGERLSKREQQRFYLLRRLYGGCHG